MAEEYDWKITVIKAGKTLLAYGIPALIAVIAQIDPAIMSLTVGTILTAIGNWAKHQ